MQPRSAASKRDHAPARPAAVTVFSAAVTLLVACSAPSKAPVSEPAAARGATPAACGTRTCGPAPTTHEDCGSCTTPGLLACNDGVCEATCDATRCAAMNYDESDCGPRPQCATAGPGTGSYRTKTDGVSCGVVDLEDCSPCDVTGKGDGRCEGERCVALGTGTCK